MIWLEKCHISKFKGKKMIEKYNHVFIESFGVTDADLKNLEYQGVKAWDSVGHMALMAALEEAFDIEMEIDDIIGFSSYNVGKTVLNKYGVNVDG